jgi:putative transposase
VLAAGGTQNHVHLLLRIPPTRPVSESIRDLKANSSRYMSETSGHFAWQDGYAAISVSPSQVDAVRAYTDGQEQHHEKHTYEREITALLDKSGIALPARVLAVMPPLTRLNPFVGHLPALTRRAHTIPPCGLEQSRLKR